MTKRPKARRKSLRKLHRWAGIGAAVFVLWLAVTGLLLNHSTSLGLDSNFVDASWLLGPYGIEDPVVGPSFRAGASTVSFVEGRWYLDARPIADGLSALAGAVQFDDYIIAADTAELIVLNDGAEILERWPVEAEIVEPIIAIAPTEGGVAIRTATGRYEFDWESTGIHPFVWSDAEPDWAEPVRVDAALVASITDDYRGSGVSWERLLLDLHSGRLAGLSGALVMDLAALALVVLAVSGFVLWRRR